MTPETRKLAALVAVFLPARAASLLRWLATADAEEASAWANRLAKAPRAERLVALAESVARPRAVAESVVEAWITRERPRVAGAIRSLLPPDLRKAAARPAQGRPVSPLLARLCAERVAAVLGWSAARSMDCAADLGRPSPPAQSP